MFLIIGQFFYPVGGAEMGWMWIFVVLVSCIIILLIAIGSESKLSKFKLKYFYKISLIH